MDVTRFDDRIVATAIASLPLVGPQRLRLLLHELGPQTAWLTITGEIAPTARIAALLTHDELGRRWRAAATHDLLVRTSDVVSTRRITVIMSNDDAYPECLRGDPSAPALLFAVGDPSALRHRRVGVVGTRAASASGRHFAKSLSRDLAQAGVAVVSGLARGIDGAAHRGALDARIASITPSIAPPIAPPIAVVASGVDVVYPREHAALWSEVERHGVVLSESPPGCAPDAFRFPLRNRILAALSEVLVVVESRATGGSMITVDEALKRGIAVMAVPGSPHNPASAGTNLLLSQGAATVCDATDVLVALGLDHRRDRVRCEHRIAPSIDDGVVLDALAHAPLTFDQLVARVGLPLTDVALRLGRLEAHGWVTSNAGWWEALVSP